MKSHQIVLKLRKEIRRKFLSLFVAYLILTWNFVCFGVAGFSNSAEPKYETGAGINMCSAIFNSQEEVADQNLNILFQHIKEASGNSFGENPVEIIKKLTPKEQILFNQYLANIDFAHLEQNDIDTLLEVLTPEKSILELTKGAFSKRGRRDLLERALTRQILLHGLVPTLKKYYGITNEQIQGRFKKMTRKISDTWTGFSPRIINRLNQIVFFASALEVLNQIIAEKTLFVSYWSYLLLVPQFNFLNSKNIYLEYKETIFENGLNSVLDQISNQNDKRLFADSINSSLSKVSRKYFLTTLLLIALDTGYAVSPDSFANQYRDLSFILNREAIVMQIDLEDIHDSPAADFHRGSLRKEAFDIAKFIDYLKNSSENKNEQNYVASMKDLRELVNYIQLHYETTKDPLFESFIASQDTSRNLNKTIQKSE